MSGRGSSGEGIARGKRILREILFHISTSKNINENKGKVEEIENWSCQEGRPVEEREGEGRG